MRVSILKVHGVLYPDVHVIEVESKEKGVADANNLSRKYHMLSGHTYAFPRLLFTYPGYQALIAINNGKLSISEK